MLRCFFEEGSDPDLFSGLKIMEAGEKYTSMMGQYPVIFLTLKSAKTGKGRSDILVKPVRIFEKAFVIELKAVNQEGKKPVTLEMMDEAAEEALKQIDDNAYTDALLEDGYGNIGRYGISFFRKDCRVHYKDGYEE